MRWTCSKLLFWSLLVVFLVYFVIWKHRPSKSSYARIELGNGQTSLIHFRERFPPNSNTTVVLLHGQAFDSRVWLRTNTLEVLHHAGYRVIAIDLPGHGYSPGPLNGPSVAKRGLILRELLKKLNAIQAVIVSPSMSGTYSLPLVVRGDLPLKGFVPVAVDGWDHFSDAEYAMLTIPTYLIYGENDKDYGPKSRAKLRHIRKSRQYVILGAGHACYLQSPKEFNEALLSFITHLNENTTRSSTK